MRKLAFAQELVHGNGASVVSIIIVEDDEAPLNNLII
jgi:hypothetical protein